MFTKINLVISRLQLTLLFCLVTAAPALAQPFHADEQGYVADPAFALLIKAKHYQLVSRFDTVRTTPVILIARALAGNKEVKIDINGKIVTDQELYKRVPGDLKGFAGDEGILYNDAPDKDAYMLVNVNGKWGTVDKKTRKQGLPTVYDGLSFMQNGLVEIVQGGKRGLAFSSGKVIKQPQYDYIRSTIFASFKNGGYELLVTQLNGKQGLLTLLGDELLPPVYDRIDDCFGCDLGGKMLQVSQDGKIGMASATGKIIVAPQYGQLKPITYKGQILVATDKTPDARFGMIDSTGRLLLPMVYSKISYLNSANVLLLNSGDRMKPLTGIADLSGKIILPAAERQIPESSGNTVIIKENGKTGAYLRRGVLLPATYSSIDLSIDRRYLLLRRDSLNGVADMYGKILLPVQYNEVAAGFNKFVARKGSVWQLFDAAGKPGKKLKYDQIIAGGDYLAVQQNGKWGVMDTGGNIIIPIKYEKFHYPNHPVNDGLAVVSMGDKVYLVDRYGNEVDRTPIR